MADKKIRKRKLGSYPFISVIFSVTLSLLVIGVFGLLFMMTNSLTTIIQENVEIQVYLNKEIRNSEITRIQRTIVSKDFVNNNENIPGIDLITEEEAARQFMEDTGEDFTEFLGDNPLRDLFTVKVAPEYQSVDSLKLIKEDLEQISGVFEVSFVESLVESINDNLTKIGGILIGIAGILILVVVILINNTIKLALFSQRFLIRSMQLVGATGSFVKRPFLARATLYGFGSGVLASGLLYTLMMTANEYVEDLTALHTLEMLFALFGVLILVGMTVTYLSTFFAIRKYLSTSLDELY